MAKFEVNRVSLGGVPLQLRPEDNHGWTLAAGVKPVIRNFVVDATQADLIEARAQTQIGGRGTVPRKVKRGPLELKIEQKDGETVTVKGLYFVERLPGPNKNYSVIRIADQRIWWSYQLVERDYNVRRRSGDRRIVGGQFVEIGGERLPNQLGLSVPDLTYARWSMNNNRPWTALEVLQDVLSEVSPKAKVDNFKIQDPVESLTLRDPGDQALSRALQHIPGAMVTVDLDGSVRVFNALDRSEIAQAKRMEGGRYFFGGEWRITDLSSVRPPAVTTYTDREIEMRFDYDTQQSGSYVKGREEPTLDNVVASPDRTLRVNGKDVAEGTFLTFPDWYTALAADTTNPPPNDAVSLTDAIVRRWHLAGYGLLHSTYAALNGGAVDRVWAKRIGAAQEHWRRTFRILPQWMDKIKSVRAHRAALLDPENGVRARAEAYCDYTVKPTGRSLMRNNKAGGLVNGYAADLKNADVSPFLVSILDEETGILQITPKVDPYGVGVAIAPGQPESIADVPSLTAGETSVLWDKVSLKASWKLAVVLTVVPASPNGLGRLQAIRITPAEAATYLPSNLGPIGTAKGPEASVFSSGSTARFGWLDADAQTIKESVWDGTPLPDRLWVNKGNCRALAIAQAARWYALLVDRGRGQLTTSLDPKAKVTGNCLEVTHELAGGVAQTRVVMPKPGVPVSVWSMLPEGVRRRLLRLVQV